MIYILNTLTQKWIYFGIWAKNNWVKKIKIQNPNYATIWTTTLVCYWLYHYCFTMAFSPQLLLLMLFWSLHILTNNFIWQCRYPWQEAKKIFHHCPRQRKRLEKHLNNHLMLNVKLIYLDLLSFNNIEQSPFIVFFFLIICLLNLFYCWGYLLCIVFTRAQKKKTM